MAKSKRDPRLKRAGVSGFNKPKRTPNHPKKSHVVVAKSGGKAKKFADFGTTIAGSGPDGLKTITTSGDLLDGAKKAAAVTDGASTAKTLAIAADAGADWIVTGTLTENAENLDDLRNKLTAVISALNS